MDLKEYMRSLEGFREELKREGNPTRSSRQRSSQDNSARQTFAKGGNVKRRERHPGGDEVGDEVDRSGPDGYGFSTNKRTERNRQRRFQRQARLLQARKEEAQENRSRSRSLSPPPQPTSLSSSSSSSSLQPSTSSRDRSPSPLRSIVAQNFDGNKFNDHFIHTPTVNYEKYLDGDPGFYKAAKDMSIGRFSERRKRGPGKKSKQNQMPASSVIGMNNEALDEMNSFLRSDSTQNRLSKGKPVTYPVRPNTATHKSMGITIDSGKGKTKADPKISTYPPGKMTEIVMQSTPPSNSKIVPTYLEKGKKYAQITHVTGISGDPIITSKNE